MGPAAPRWAACTGHFRGGAGRDHRIVGRVQHYHAIHFVSGARVGRGPRAVRGEEAIPDARRREVFRQGPRQRQLRTGSTADETCRHLAAEPAGAGDARPRPAWALPAGIQSERAISEPPGGFPERPWRRADERYSRTGRLWRFRRFWRRRLWGWQRRTDDRD